MNRLCRGPEYAPTPIRRLTRHATSYGYTFAGTNQYELTSQSTPDGDYDYAYGRTDSVGRPVIESLTRTSG